MKQILKLSEYEALTGKSPPMTKKLIKDGKLKGWQDGPKGHWMVEVEADEDLTELKKMIMKQSEIIERLCKHLGVQIE